VGQRNDALSLGGAINRAAEQLPRLGLSVQTARAMWKAWHRFGRFASAGSSSCGPAAVPSATATAFVQARQDDGSIPSVAAMHWRRSAVRLLYRVWREVGLAEGDPTLDLHLPKRSSLGTRPLTDDEIALCRWASLSSATNTRLPAVWALAEAGATSAEIPLVRASDVDISIATVRLRGSTKIDARDARLTAWGATQLERRMTTVGDDPEALLVYRGSGSPESAQASVSGAIGDVLRRAGLGDEPDVRPRSVTAWVGRQVLADTGRIEAVARTLGLRSLDRAAALIGWDWRAT
jgi:integrase/recombinase XerC